MDSSAPARQPPAAGFVIGYDVGTTSMKAVLIDSAGHIHAAASAPYPLHLPAPGHAEQDPYDWWRAMGDITRNLLAQVPVARGQVRALSVGAQMCGCLLVDARGIPLHRCLIWMDTRSAEIARRITRGIPSIAGYGMLRAADWLLLANGAPNRSGKDPLTKMLWLREHEPDLWRRCARVLDVKDWLVHQLTGEFTTTPDVAQLSWLMDNRLARRDWSDRHLRRFGLTRAYLPSIIDASAQAGTLTAFAAEHLGLPQGVAVAGGVGDVNACALAAGPQDEAAYHLYLGTSMWIAAHTRRRRVDPFSGIATICAAHADRYLWLATQETAGAAVVWAAERFAFGEGSLGARALDADAAAVIPGPDTPVFAPWMFGERVPVDDPRLRGTLAGISLRSSRAEVAYAVLAGVALNTRWALHHAEAKLAPAQPSLPVMGGGAGSAIWMQIMADVLQRPLQVLERPALAGARGAAVAASRLAGWFPSLDAGALAMAAPSRRVEPNPERAAWAHARYARHVGLWKASSRWHRALAEN